jgi:hypothetical protein
MARATATAATATAAYRPGASTVTTLMMVPAVCAVTMLADLRLAGCRREGYRVRKLAALARDRARDDAVRNHGVFWNVITGLGRQHARPGPAGVRHGDPGTPRLPLAAKNRERG